MSLPPPPHDIDINEDGTTRVIASVLVPAIFAVIAVVLRIWSRYLSKAGFKWDDYLIVIALVFSTGDCILNILMVELGGMGRHIWHPSVDMVVLYQLIFAMEFVYSCAIPTIKMSVIMFYHRIFSVPHFKYVLYVLSFLVLGWFVGVMVVNVVQCQPLDYLWMQFADPNAEGKCIDVEAYFLGNGIAEAITDFFILFAPLYEVYKLQMPTAQKLAVSGIFGLGAFTCVAGALRCYAVIIMTENEDVTWNFGRGFIWSSIEPSLGIVSACLPTLRPLIRHFFPRGFLTSSRKASQYKDSHVGHASQSRDFYRLEERRHYGRDTDEIALTNDIRKGAAASTADVNHEDDPNYSITVQREILMTSNQAGK